MAATPQHGVFVWNELNSRDPEKAMAFYSATLGWRFEPMPMEDGGAYFIAWLGETRVAGLFPLAGPAFESLPAHWFSYIAVDDVDARLEKAVAAGGEALRPAFDVPGVGRIAVVSDTEGAVTGWISPQM
ncbi:VOC family protein [Ancylobacter mangrovi]|uniref:VOC family protein n=1 Tax=Ancylobacter mangrovi TaxID=2972472 RepID=UPI00216160E6|nr:VOC family protein [Ancylobacter mangrovi]MCS0502331.1 VOC family protein [Ancylobacter mangrovi]